MSSTRTSKTESLQADVVVIGSGGGLAAAVTAAEAGASVILLEKVNILGGYTRLANGLMACESPVQKRLNITVTRDEIFRIFMDWNHWYRVNPRVVRAFVDKSGDTIRWLEEKGVEFELATNDYGVAAIHIPTDMMASIQKTLIKNAKELGVKSFVRTSGKKILLGEKGEVAGVLYDMGYCYDRLKKPKEARQVYERYVKAVKSEDPAAAKRVEDMLKRTKGR